MKQVKLNGMVLEIHDGDIDEMPVHRFQMFNQSVAVEAGLGSDLRAFDDHLARMKRFVKYDKKREFEVEVENVRQCLHFVIKGISPRMIAFIYLIDKIDGKPLEDFSTENVQRLTEVLGRKGLTARMVDKLINLVKKNAERDLVDRFPKMMTNAKQAEKNQRIAHRTRTITKGITDGEEVTAIAAKVEEIDKGLMAFDIPSVFTGAKGVENQMKMIYERTVAFVGEMIGRDAKALTVMEYYTNVEILQARQKASKK